MDQSAQFWDNIAERYAKKPVADEAAYQKKLEVTRQYLRPDMQVMEFGCGTGSTAITHAPYVKHIEAIDVSAKMIEIARGKASAENIENVTFSCAAIDQFSVADESLDVVLGLSILHLLKNKEEVIARVYKMLKPGGVFVTSTACIGDAKKFFRFLVPMGRLMGLMPLVKVFTSRKLEKCMTDAGFKIDYKWHPDKNKALFLVAVKSV